MVAPATHLPLPSSFLIESIQCKLVRTSNPANLQGEEMLALQWGSDCRNKREARWGAEKSLNVQNAQNDNSLQHVESAQHNSAVNDQSQKQTTTIALHISLKKRLRDRQTSDTLSVHSHLLFNSNHNLLNLIHDPPVKHAFAISIVNYKFLIAINFHWNFPLFPTVLKYFCETHEWSMNSSRVRQNAIYTEKHTFDFFIKHSQLFFQFYRYSRLNCHQLNLLGTWHRINFSFESCRTCSLFCWSLQRFGERKNDPDQND